jgi:hypothetical protein
MREHACSQPIVSNSVHLVVDSPPAEPVRRRRGLSIVARMSTFLKSASLDNSTAQAPKSAPIMPENTALSNALLPAVLPSFSSDDSLLTHFPDIPPLDTDKPLPNPQEQQSRSVDINSSEETHMWYPNPSEYPTLRFAEDDDDVKDVQQSSHPETATTSQDAMTEELRKLYQDMVSGIELNDLSTKHTEDFDPFLKEATKLVNLYPTHFFDDGGRTGHD